MVGPPFDGHSCIVCNGTSDLVVVLESSSSLKLGSLQSTRAPRHSSPKTARGENDFLRAPLFGLKRPGRPAGALVLR